MCEIWRSFRYTKCTVPFAVYAVFVTYMEQMMDKGDDVSAL